MKQLSQQHPKPDAPLYTTFLSKEHDLNDAAFYHLIARHPQDPDSTDIIYIFDNEKKLIAVQSEKEPRIEAPLALKLVDIKGKVTTYNIELPRSFPDFPTYENLVKVLAENNKE